MSIIIFGSINIDLIATTTHLPTPGETINGNNFFTAGGGKGANQAVAAARLGIPTKIVGRLGNDSFGQQLLTSLQTANVDTTAVVVDENIHTGVAAIAVDGSGENSIIVVPGANHRINNTDVERLRNLLFDVTALLLQLEIPMEVAISAAKIAQEMGVKVILDPAPMPVNFPDDFYSLIDIITPNEIEASQLVGFTVNNQENGTQAAIDLCQRGVKNAVVKIGAKGVVCATEKETFFQPAFVVEAIDTVAAGDAFNGGLAAALDTGLSLKEAVKWGAVAGALCVTKSGAQPAMPDRKTFDNFLRSRE
ncbi:ribokinase [Okeania sp.]|uniref:ribokinase n=1 Tax=Okeania sp. TaxID=3100323 RepID=UPI002B4AD86D|nr:ribokinase [Okeania sp.]MEB3342856.1 ribokinase [Okeania sp.]